MMILRCFRQDTETKLKTSPSLLWVGALMLLTVMGCPEENGAGGGSSSKVDGDGGPVDVPECVVMDGDCPNACVGGTGIMGETCGGTKDCMCGLFCSAGICSPYENEYEGCTCEGALPDFGLVEEEPTCAELEDGETCDDGDPCTVLDACNAGACVGSAKDCSGLDAVCQSVGVCDAATGECEAQAIAENTVCDDGDLCTLNDSCQDGQCVGGESVEACSCTGIADGVGCDDQDPCTENDACASEVCGGAAKDCSSLDGPCQTGTCSAESGACTFTVLADGTSCEDGNLCTLGDQCLEGECVYSDLKDCGQDCRSGLCAPETGTCDGPVLEDGTVCEDGDTCTNNACVEGACTVIQNACECVGQEDGASCSDGNNCSENDRCLNEVCVGDEIVCEGSADGCLLGQCNNESGTCETVPADFGTLCDDADACTLDDYCSEGFCQGVAKDCNADATDCQAGTCNSETGNCDLVAMPDGLLCEATDSCVSAATCQTGLCTAVDGATKCGVCDSLELGASCDDGSACTSNDKCILDGTGTKICLGEDVNCTDSSSACSLGGCDVTDGSCRNFDVPLGGSCFDNDACTEYDICTSEGCAGTPYFVCGTQPTQCEVFSSIASPATAMEITVSGPEALIRGRIDNIGEADWYAMNLHEGDIISISTHGNCGTEVDTFIQLLDGALLEQENDMQRSILAYNDNNGSSIWSKIENYTIPADGKYYVEVQTHGSSQDLSYLLAVDRLGPTFCEETADCACEQLTCQAVGEKSICRPTYPGEVEPNDNTNTNNPLTFGETVAGRLSNYEDEDRFSAELQINVPVAIETHALCGEVTDTLIKVFDPAGTLVAVNDNSGLAKIQHFLPRTTGTYEVEVLGINGAVGPYLLTMGSNTCEEDESCSALCGSLACSGGHCGPANPETEDNDSLSGAGRILWDDPQYGSFGKTNDRDLRFAWMEAGVYSFETAPFCGQASDTILAIYKLRPDNNTSLLATNDNGGEGLHSKVSNIELTSLTPVLVEVSAFGSSVGDYVLTTNGTVGPQASQTIGEILGANENLSFALQALESAELLDLVNGAGVRTFYVPTNAAFAGLAAARGLDDVSELLTELDLSRILKHHMIDGALHTPLLDGQREVTNLLEYGIVLKPQEETWTFGGAEVSGDSIMATNGAVQVMAAAVNPPPDPLASCDTAGLECVSNSSCTDATGMAECVCDPGYDGVYCDPVVCAVDEYVSNHTCQPCAAGRSHPANTPAPGDDTECADIICLENENVVGNTCQPCDVATPNEPGDNASGADTACDTPICGENEYVLAHECLPCAAGTTNAAGDIITRADTVCDITYCGQNERVEDHICTPCDRHFVNEAGDDASVEDYSFTKRLGTAVYNPDILAYSPDGSLWVTDWYDNTLWRIDANENATQVLEADLYQIVAIDFSADGSRVYFVDGYSNQIVNMNTDGTDIVQINISFGYVNDVAVGQDGVLYILDSGDSKLYAMDPANNTLTRIAQDLLVYPSRIDMGANGALYVIDDSSLVMINLEEMTKETLLEDFYHYNYHLDDNGDLYFNHYPEQNQESNGDNFEDEDDPMEDTGPQVVRLKANGEMIVISSGRDAHYIQVKANGQVMMTYYDGYGVSLYDFGAIDTTCSPKTHCEEDEFALFTTCEYCPEGTANPAGEPIDINEEEDTDGGVEEDPRGCEATFCGYDENVVDNACVACAPGSTNAPNDDASGVVFTASVLTEEDFENPTAMARNTNGDLYIATDTTIYHVASNGDVTPVVTDLQGVSGLAAAADGTLYFASQYTGSVTRVTFGENASSDSLEFWVPRAIALGPDGNLFVAEGEMQEIYRVKPSAFDAQEASDAGLGIGYDDMNYDPDRQSVAWSVDATALAVGIDGSLYAVTDEGEIVVMKAHKEQHQDDGYGYGYGEEMEDEYVWYDSAEAIEHSVTGLGGTIAVDAFGNVFVGHYDDESGEALAMIGNEGAAATTVYSSSAWNLTDLIISEGGDLHAVASVQSYEMLFDRACVDSASDSGPSVGATSYGLSVDDVTGYTTEMACKELCDADPDCNFVQDDAQGMTEEEFNTAQAEQGNDFGCTGFSACVNNEGEGETGTESFGNTVFKKSSNADFVGRSSILQKFERTSLNTECDPTLCIEDFYVENNACVPCAPGASNEANDNAMGDDTVCEAILCEDDQYVQLNVCTSCPAGQENAAGDDATGENTACEDTICEENHFVSSNVCEPCAPGTTRAAGDNATGTDTSCEEVMCGVNQAVINHHCVECPTGWERSSFDNAAQDDTFCQEQMCGETEFVENFQCNSCDPGYGSEGIGNAAMAQYASSTLIDSGLNQPKGLAADSAGNVYIADLGGNQVRKVDADGNLTDIGAGYDGPRAVDLGADGTVYVADTGNGKIKTVAADGSMMESIQTFVWPVDVAIGPSGDVFVADLDAQKVYVLAASAFQAVDTAGDGAVVNGTAVIEGIAAPVGLSVSAQDVLYVSDTESHQVHRFVKNAYGVWGAEMGANGDTFAGPVAVQTDAYGNVYVLQNAVGEAGTQTESSTNVITNCQWCNQDYFTIDLGPGSISNIDWSVSMKDQGSATCATYAYVRLFFVKADGTETNLGQANNTSDYCNGSRTAYETVSRNWTAGEDGPLQTDEGDSLVLRAGSAFPGWEINVNAGDVTMDLVTNYSYVTKIHHSGYSEDILGPISGAAGLALASNNSLFVSLADAASIISLTGTSMDTTCTGITCEYDEYVSENVCTPCPAGSTNDEGGDDATGEDTSCTVTLCDENFHVVNNTCEYCPDGTQRPAGDEATGENTDCNEWLCAENERVNDDYACVACPRGMINAAGDNAANGLTECDFQLCAVNEQVVNNTCVACAPGTSTNEQSDASQSDTECYVELCAENENVVNYACEVCPEGEPNEAGDDPSAVIYTESVLLDSGLANPHGLAIAADGTLYIADTENASVKKRAPDGTVSEIGSGFVLPKGIDVNDAGEVFVADFGAGAIKKIGTDNTVTTLMDGLGSPSTLESEGLEDLAVGPQGNIFVTFRDANSQDAYVLKMTAQGQDELGVACVLENGNCVISSWGITSPKGLDITADGTVYVADHDNDVSVTKLVPSAGGMYFSVSVVSNSYGATGLQVNANGVVFFNDNWNASIKQASLFGMVTDVPLGNWSEMNPQLRGLALAANGDLYVTKTEWHQSGQMSSIVKLTAASGNTDCTLCDACGYCDIDTANDCILPMNAYPIYSNNFDNLMLDSTVGAVGFNDGVWGFYESGTASDPSNGLSVFLSQMRNSPTHRMSHNETNPGILTQTSGETTSNYDYSGIPGSGNDTNAKGVVLEYTATEETTLTIDTKGANGNNDVYNDSVIVIFTLSHLSGSGNTPFKVVTFDSGDGSRFKVTFPYFEDNPNHNVYYIALTSYNTTDLYSNVPITITAD